MVRKANRAPNRSGYLMGVKESPPLQKATPNIICSGKPVAKFDEKCICLGFYYFTVVSSLRTQVQIKYNWKCNKYN